MKEKEGEGVEHIGICLYILDVSILLHTFPLLSSLNPIQVKWRHKLILIIHKRSQCYSQESAKSSRSSLHVLPSFIGLLTLGRLQINCEFRHQLILFNRLASQYDKRPVLQTLLYS